MSTDKLGLAKVFHSVPVKGIAAWPFGYPRPAGAMYTDGNKGFVTVMFRGYASALPFHVGTVSTDRDGRADPAAVANAVADMFDGLVLEKGDVVGVEFTASTVRYFGWNMERETEKDGTLLYAIERTPTP